MKAKVKTTGEIVEVISHYHNVYYQSIDTQKLYNMDELDFNLDTPQKQSVTIDGWVARSKYGYLNLFGCLPKRYCGDWLGARGYYQSPIPTDSFPDLKWTDEPRKVKITIEEV